MKQLFIVNDKSVATWRKQLALRGCKLLRKSWRNPVPSDGVCSNSELPVTN